MVNGHLLKKGVREQEEDNVVIPLCKETKCLGAPEWHSS